MNNLVRSAFPTDSLVRRDTIEQIAQSSHIYVIFITPRSGSTWLTEIAMNSGLLGVPQEWLNEGWIHTSETSLNCLPPKLVGTSNINEYLLNVATLQQGDGSTVGIELSQYQTQCLIELLEDPVHALKSIVPIYLRRKKLVAQSISFYRSRKSGFWHSYQSDPEKVARFNSIEYNKADIYESLEMILASENYFESLFKKCQIYPLRIYYENLQENPVEVLSRIHAHINQIDSSVISRLPDADLKQVSDKKNTEWEIRFLQESPGITERIQIARPPLL